MSDVSNHQLDDNIEDNADVAKFIEWLAAKNLCKIEDSPYMFCSAEGGFQGPAFGTLEQIDEYLDAEPDDDRTAEICKTLKTWACDVAPELGYIDTRDEGDR